MKVFCRSCVVGLFLLIVGFPVGVLAGQQYLQGLSIKAIRVVGNYTGTTADNTVELYFTEPLPFDASLGCTDTSRVYINAAHSHVVSAAYAAYLADRKVSINVDTALGLRWGACEISYLDVLK